MVDKDKRAARELAARDGIPYARALREVRSRPRPPIPEQAIAALQADPAAGYGADDWSWEARSAREEAERLTYWHHRRSGRQVRLWEADIEVRCAAVDELEAWWRLALGYLRAPVYRVPDMSGSWCTTQELHDGPQHDGRREVALVPAAGLAAGEWERLLDDYPRRPVPWPDEWTVRGPEKTFDVGDYAASLRRAAARAAGEPVDAPDRPGLPGELTGRLRAWRAVHCPQFLAGVTIDDARERAAQLAATIVDVHGRPAGRVLDVRPDDGMPGRDGIWLHPVTFGGSVHALGLLFDDYEATTAPAVLLAGEADRLEQQWRAENAESAAYEARLHTQPDGTRTLSTPAELADVAELMNRRYRREPTEVIRKQAEHWRYMADRVYSKVVNDDNDLKRIEEADAMAKALTALADQRERQARPPASRTRADVDVDELVWITPADADAGDEEAGRVWRGADAADHAARLEDALSAQPDDGR